MPSSSVQLDLEQAMETLMSDFLKGNEIMEASNMECLVIRLTNERYLELCKPRSNALVIKLLK